jgi:hypothetical protein
MWIGMNTYFFHMGISFRGATLCAECVTGTRIDSSGTSFLKHTKAYTP